MLKAKNGLLMLVAAVALLGLSESIASAQASDGRYMLVLIDASGSMTKIRSSDKLSRARRIRPWNPY